MSMTVTMNEAGLVALPPSVLALFGIQGATQVEVDVQDDGIKLRFDSAVPAGQPRPVVGIENRDGWPVIAGTPYLSDEAVVRAIKADRDER